MLFRGAELAAAFEPLMEGMQAIYEADRDAIKEAIAEDPDLYREHIEAGRLRTGPNGALDYCRVRWHWRPLMDCAFVRWLTSDAMNQIAAEYGGAENVRVVIGCMG